MKLSLTLQSSSLFELRTLSAIVKNIHYPGDQFLECTLFYADLKAILWRVNVGDPVDLQHQNLKNLL